MTTYTLQYKTEVYIYVKIDAENDQEALDKANDMDLTLRSYCGNGGCDKLVGTTESYMSIEPSEEVEFDSIVNED